VTALSVALNACSADAKAAPPTTTPPDTTGLVAYLRANYGTKVWIKHVRGSTTEAGGVVNLLTDLNPGASAAGLLMCQEAHTWWSKSPTPVTELRVKSAAGYTMLSDPGDYDGCR
jgi:hypothetical protein